ncbi:hypothetical protein EP01_00880 [Bdellovibrio bacteriovorus]|nr:hypothetical protein EP01_00880 [Bdellovibrio bacteriovorus]
MPTENEKSPHDGGFIKKAGQKGSAAYSDGPFSPAVAVGLTNRSVVCDFFSYVPEQLYRCFPGAESKLAPSGFVLSAS